jgi:hypothetical protein
MLFIEEKKIVSPEVQNIDENTEITERQGVYEGVIVKKIWDMAETTV